MFVDIIPGFRSIGRHFNRRRPTRRVVPVACAVLFHLGLLIGSGLFAHSQTVAAWGNNLWGQLGNGTRIDSAIPQPVNIPGRVMGVSGSHNHSLAVTKDGKVYAWGNNFWGQLGSGPGGSLVTPQLVNVPGRVVGVSGGGDHSLALTDEGIVYAWGRNNRDNSVTERFSTRQHRNL
jgi:alpha-tubulin suppressor-like RCC1 family protein